MSQTITFKTAVEEIIVDVMYDELSVKYVEDSSKGLTTDLEDEEYAIPVVASFLSWLKCIDEEKYKIMMSYILKEYKDLRLVVQEKYKDDAEFEAQTRRASLIRIK